MAAAQKLGSKMTCYFGNANDLHRAMPPGNAKLGDGVGTIARVAIWTGINIDWSKRTGRLPRDFSLEDSRARTRAYS